jgi:hypothetical protein
MGLCLVAATLTVTTVTQRQPTVDLGNLATAKTGSGCATSPKVVSHLRSSYESGHQATMTSYRQVRSVLLVGDSTACTLYPGLQAVGPSFGMQFGNGTVIGCGIVSGTLAPIEAVGIDFTAYTKTCQGKVNRIESGAIEHDRPSLIVWASTDEHNSIMSGTKQLIAGSPKWRSAMLQRVDHRVDQFLSTGARVVFLLEPPAVHASTGLDSTDVAYDQMNAVLKDVAARHPHHVTYVNLAARVCPSGPPCPFVVDGMGSTRATITQAIRPDLIHYLPGGSLWVARWLVPQIATAAQSLSS